MPAASAASARSACSSALATDARLRPCEWCRQKRLLINPGPPCACSLLYAMRLFPPLASEMGAGRVRRVLSPLLARWGVQRDKRPAAWHQPGCHRTTLPPGGFLWPGKTCIPRPRLSSNQPPAAAGCFQRTWLLVETLPLVRRALCATASDTCGSVARGAGTQPGRITRATGLGGGRAGPLAVERGCRGAGRVPARAGPCRRPAPPSAAVCSREASAFIRGRASSYEPEEPWHHGRQGRKRSWGRSLLHSKPTAPPARARARRAPRPGKRLCALLRPR